MAYQSIMNAAEKRIGDAVVLATRRKNDVKVKLEKTGAEDLKHARVITEAWKNDSRMRRIEKVIHAIHQHAAEDSRNILSVNVFTPNEWKERKATLRRLERISKEFAPAKPGQTAKRPTARISSRKKTAS